MENRAQLTDIWRALGRLDKAQNSIACRCYLTGSTGKLYYPSQFANPSPIHRHISVSCTLWCGLFAIFRIVSGGRLGEVSQFANPSPIHCHISVSCTLWCCLFAIFRIVSGWRLGEVSQFVCYKLKCCVAAWKNVAKMLIMLYIYTL